MSKNIPVITISKSEFIVSTLKLLISSTLMDCCEALKKVEVPEDNQVETYKQLVAEMKKVREGIFIDTLNSYNDFLTQKHQLESMINDQDKKNIQDILRYQSDFKNTSIVALVLSLLFPSYFPIIMGINIPRMGVDWIGSKRRMNKIVWNHIQMEEWNSIQNPFFDLTCDLREDYHKTKDEWKKLEEKATIGENIIPELISIMSPERLSLPEVKIEDWIEMEEQPSLELKEEPYQKKKIKKSL